MPSDRIAEKRLSRKYTYGKDSCWIVTLRPGLWVITCTVRWHSEQPDRAELNSDTKPIVVAPVFGNKGAIGIVKMAMPSELIERRLA